MSTCLQWAGHVDHIGKDKVYIQFWSTDHKGSDFKEGQSVDGKKMGSGGGNLYRVKLEDLVSSGQDNVVNICYGNEYSGSFI